MRHGKKVNHLGRTDSHRKAMLSNMATSLILHKRITTTLAKAKALRGFVEPLLTKSKNDTTHSRRVVFSYLQDKDAVSILFREIAEKIASRPGGYTRIIKMENRLGDNAEMAMIELVDYNTVYGTDVAKTEKKSTRRRGGKGGNKTAAPAAAPATEEVVEAAPVAEAASAESPAVETEATPAAETEAPEAPAANEENAEKAE
ncbi:50S ribosomal protein L17 [Mucilaginibacter sp. L3T2-6]|uniref:50S ribosomal protein L17 n=1 Tax=Mucilaginibacter sp. L3T2-6 TaxID=3062491 RepID=UPI002674A558|nr:50S ribosomal protein L17 [Mucilaginibacter sp. L3T2-6]MDO3640423.1 50S ribosomal protein L17 [Mucilaginibacter sp. L3T2-6]MDV6213238.1 50S ribosomal protein L17 [Mucilaginibacter sp. L3T2-6]